MTHLGKMPHMEQLGTQSERLCLFVEVKSATLQIDIMLNWTAHE